MTRLGIGLATCLICAVAANAETAKVQPAISPVAAATTGGDNPPLHGVPLPLKLGGSFSLIDQHGQPRTQVDPAGNLQLLFFGYANCREICSAVLPPCYATTTNSNAG